MEKTRVHNFSAGPGALPLSVLIQAKQELVELPNVGMSVLEISHRSSMFDDIIQTAQNNLRTLLQIPNNYHILFLSGGASLQFSMIPMNFLRESGESAYYLVGGTWGKKARRPKNTVAGTPRFFSSVWQCGKTLCRPAQAIVAKGKKFAGKQ